MSRIFGKGAGTAAIVFIAGIALWPPGAVYWNSIAAVVGSAVTAGIVLTCAVAIGAAIEWALETRIRLFVGSGVVAYLGWILMIETTMTPDSPVHFLWYGVLLGCFIVGSVLWSIYAERPPLRIPTRGPE